VGVLLTAAAIAVGTGVGVCSEHRWPSGAVRAARRALVVMLYVLLPPVIFFNLAAANVGLDRGIGLAIGILASALTATFAWWVASRFLHLSRPQTGAVICAVLSVNTGYLGYPLTVALLGRDQLSTAVLYDVLVTGPCLLLGAFAIGAASAPMPAKARANACAPSSPATRRSAPPSPGSLPRGGLPPRSWLSSPRRYSSRSCHSASSRSGRRWPRTPSTATCRSHRRSRGPSC
jgi:hypothetical protein